MIVHPHEQGGGGGGSITQSFQASPKILSRIENML